ncbi:NUDIX hydrolase [Planctomycetota bacterium]
MSKGYGLAVGALIENDKGEYLLVQRIKTSKFFTGMWETPGGKLDPGESFADALVREAKEEIGLEIVLDGLAGASEFELPHIKIVLLYMKAHVVSGEVILSHEHQDYAWLPLSEFRTKPLTPALASLVEKLKSE